MVGEFLYFINAFSATQFPCWLLVCNAGFKYLKLDLWPAEGLWQIQRGEGTLDCKFYCTQRFMDNFSFAVQIFDLQFWTTKGMIFIIIGDILPLRFFRISNQNSKTCDFKIIIRLKFSSCHYKTTGILIDWLLCLRQSRWPKN